MGILNFFRKRRNLIGTDKAQNLGRKEQVKQGFYRERGYFPPNPLCNPRTDPEFFMYEEGEYKDGVREGHWVIKDKAGHEKGYADYHWGRKHGLEKSPHGTYTLYHLGQVVKSHLELTKEWKSKVRELKVEKKWDDEERQKTLKTVLEAQTKEGKKEALKRFHLSKAPKGVKRRTALKFDEKSND